MNNGDKMRNRINNYSNAELAKIFDNIGDINETTSKFLFNKKVMNWCEYCELGDLDTCTAKCEKAILKWLNKE